LVFHSAEPRCDPVPLSADDVAKVPYGEVSSDLPVGCRVCGADTEGGGEVEAVVFMRGEVRLDRDAAVFDVSSCMMVSHSVGHDVDHAGFVLQVLEGHVKEVVGKHILRRPRVGSEALSTSGNFEQEASHNVC
jgi:hypothetical protein